MEKQLFLELFTAIFRANQLEKFLTDATIDSFYRFTELLTAENQVINLTAIRDVPSMIAKHYADSLLAEPYIPSGATLLDVGCGGGFPTIPLAIVRQDLHIFCIDSTGKKIDFVKKAIKELKIPNVNPYVGRIEDHKFAHWREGFDVVTARAVANLGILAELTLPFVKKGGILLALKGSRVAEELQSAANAIQLLGGGAAMDHPAKLFCPQTDCSDVPNDAVFNQSAEERHLIIVPKQSATPSIYPREYRIILKKPL